MVLHRIVLQLKWIKPSIFVKSGFSTQSIFCKAKPSIYAQLGVDEPPHKPIVPYFRYLFERRLTLKHLTNKEITSKVAIEWRCFSSVEKQPYLDSYHKDLQVYKHIADRYWSSLSPLDREKIRAWKREKTQKKLKAREEREKKKQQVLLEKPKGSYNSYMLFSLEQSHHSPSKESLEKTKMLWDSLGEEGQLPYKLKAKKLREQHVKELHAWELKAIKMGYKDLVRKSSPVLAAHLLEECKSEVGESEYSSSDKRQSVNEA